MDEKQTRFAAYVAASLSLTGCATSMPPSPPNQGIPLVIAACPFLTPLADPSFGATSIKLVEVAATYTKCREAALSNANR